MSEPNIINNSTDVIWDEIDKNSGKTIERKTIKCEIMETDISYDKEENANVFDLFINKLKIGIMKRYNLSNKLYYVKNLKIYKHVSKYYQIYKYLLILSIVITYSNMEKKLEIK